MLKKLMIICWFGPYPDYLHNWIANMEYLKPMGYDYLIFSNLELFEKRVRERLGIEPCIIPGTGKPWDYRAALGVLFEEEIKGYDYYGHTDFDCLYGEVNKWMPDDELKRFDIWSNHHNYICGPWTLYKNNDFTKNIYKECPNWKKYMEDPTPSGWVEGEFSRVIDRLHSESKINRKYTFFQGYNPAIDTNLTFKNGVLYDLGQEIFMFHFNRSKPKKYPIEDI